MHTIALVVVTLLATAAQASATVGFNCHAADKAVALNVSGAYGTDLGSGLANFGAIVEIRDSRVPDALRKLRLARGNLSQNWFDDRELKLVTQWEPQNTGPYREVVMIVATRRGNAEENPYRGRYTLMINFMQPDAAAGAEATRLRITGRVTCGTD